MSAKQDEKQAANRRQRERQQLEMLIGEHVMDALGQPGDFQGVQVRPLWDDHYRVNVLVGADLARACVAYSYFLVTDDGGNVVAAAPPITRQHEGPARLRGTARAAGPGPTTKAADR